MSLGAKLGWAVAVCVALLIGFGAGVWIGGEMEADIQEEFLMNADLPEVCWEKLGAAAEKIIRDYEGGAPSTD